jgi:heme A synthase
MGLHRFAIATAVATFVLLIIGGLVHGTGSSLACPDWPLCHGSFFPEMTRGVEYEHTHRLVAGFVAILTVILGVAVYRDPRYRALRPLAVAAPVMVLVQALLGGLTVIFRLPKPITLSHLTLSMCFFSVLIILAIRTGSAARAGASRGSAARDAGASPLGSSARARAPRILVGVTVLAVLGQIFLGGLVRHSMAGLACVTFPLCFGHFWPPESSSVYSERVHMLHRFGAVVVTALVLTSAILVARRAPRGSLLRALAISAPVLVLIQATLGVLSVTSLLHLPTVTAHLGVGALVLANMVALWTMLSDGARDEVREDGSPERASVDALGLRADEPRSAPKPSVDALGLRADEPRSAPKPPVPA